MTWYAHDAEATYPWFGIQFSAYKGKPVILLLTVMYCSIEYFFTIPCLSYFLYICLLLVLLLTCKFNR